MRQSQAAVLERHRILEGGFATEPYEVGWAGEARWFVQVLDTSSPDTRLVLRTQVSPDGLNWCDGEYPVQVTEGTCLISWPVREFGQWLRIKGSVDGDGTFAKVLIHLTLKS